MENTVYIVRVIMPEGKGKIVVEEEQIALYYRTDENNNLIFEDANGDLVYEYHCYNWLGVRPKE